MIQEAFLELKDMSLYIESTHENLAAKNCKRFIHSRHRAAETKGKKKSRKIQGKGEPQVMCKGQRLRMTLDFSTAILETRKR